MKIHRVQIRNFRALREVDIDVSDYMSLIGPNGSGKSSVLYALDWFFGNSPIDSNSRSYDSIADDISVELWIKDLPKEASESFGSFVADGNLRLKKSFNCPTGRTSFEGTSLTGQGFSEVLNASSPATMRDAYRTLRNVHEGLEELTGSFGKDRIQLAFDSWCSDESNNQLLVSEMKDAEALFKKDGAVSKHFKFILVKGSIDFAEQISTRDKSSLMSVLTKNLLDSPTKPIIDNWMERNEESISELEQLLANAVNDSLSNLTLMVNSNLHRYDKNVSLKLSAQTSGVDVSFPSELDANVLGSGGRTESLGTQGHGVQRTVIMSMIEAINANTALGDAKSPVLVIIAAEEPELYQHPVRARSFFRTLRSLANQDGFQVCIATHSPEFISSDFLSSLRFVRKSGTYTEVKSTSLDSVAKVRNKHPKEVHEWLTKEIPRSIADAFFADMVLLTEGETDEALWPEIADLLDISFDHHGVVCMTAGSKTSLVTTKDVLSEFGVSSYIIADGDYVENDNESQENQTSQLVNDMGIVNDEGEPLYTYGDQSQVFTNFAIYRVDIEDELSRWGSYQQSMANVNPRSTKKKPHHYRMAARQSAVEDMPDILRIIATKIVERSAAMNGSPKSD